MHTIEDVKELLIRHEGFRLKPYRCTAGKLTIGVGRNLDDNGITEDEAMYMLECDIFRAIEDLRKIFNYDCLPIKARIILIDMMFNLGLSRFKSFKKMIKAVNDKDYKEAAEQMLDSKWAEQVGQRALDLAFMMKDV